MLKYPLNQQEQIVVEKLFIENKTTNQVAQEMFITSSRVNQIKAKALVKLGKETPNRKTVAEIMDSGKNPQWSN